MLLNPCQEKQDDILKLIKEYGYEYRKYSWDQTFLWIRFLMATFQYLVDIILLPYV